MSFIPPPEGSDEHVVARAFGALLMAVGVLIMLLCGLCSLAAIGFFAAEAGAHFSEAYSLLMMVALFGGVPGSAGFALFTWGRSLRKKKG